MVWHQANLTAAMPSSLSSAASRSISALLLPLLLGSCVTAKRPSSEFTAPAKWNATAAKPGPLNTAALTRWWSRFNDTTLSRLIDESLQTSPDVRTASARIEESRARRGVERSTLFPQITGGTSGSATRSDDRSANVITNRESYTASIDASWEIDLFGKLKQNVTAADADLAQVIATYEGAQVSLAAEVADAYTTFRSAQTQLAVYERNVAAREDTTQITRWREQAGEGTTFETQQAASTLEQARATIPQLKQTIKQTKNRLALLSGRTPGSLDSLLAGSSPIPQPPTMLATGIPADTLRQRPDVRAAERALEAAVARTKSAEREQLPSLTLSGSIGLEALSTGTLFSPQSAATSAAGQLMAPIFNAGRIRQTIHIQSAQEKQALIAWEKAVLTALSEVENALIAVLRTSERLQTLNSAVVSAQEAEKLAADNYQAGQIDLLQVLDAQRTLLTLEEQQAVAHGNQTSAHISLYKSLGGGWSR
jgi:NodT family efflux transporter outer membrane factor (OMF) lipoprotein